MALHTGAEGEQLLKQFIFMAKNKVTLLNQILLHCTGLWQI